MRRSTIPKIVVAVVLMSLVLGVWTIASRILLYTSGLEIRGPDESEPEYCLRLMNYHGRETKDGDRQIELAARIVDCGRSAIPLLVRKGFCGMYRYNPQPREMLEQIAERGYRDEIREQVLAAARGETGTDLDSLYCRMNGAAWALELDPTWSTFDLWMEPAILQDQQEGALSSMGARGFLEQHPVEGRPDTTVRDVDDHGKSRYRLNPEFVQWWRTHRATLIEMK